LNSKQTRTNTCGTTGEQERERERCAKEEEEEEDNNLKYYNGNNWNKGLITRGRYFYIIIIIIK